MYFSGFLLYLEWFLNVSKIQIRYSNIQKTISFLALLSFSICKVFNVKGNVRTRLVSISISKLFFLVYHQERERKDLNFPKFWGGKSHIIASLWFPHLSWSKTSVHLQLLQRHSYSCVCMWYKLSCSLITYIGFSMICKC